PSGACRPPQLTPLRGLATTALSRGVYRTGGSRLSGGVDMNTPPSSLASSTTTATTTTTSTSTTSTGSSSSSNSGGGNGNGSNSSISASSSVNNSTAITSNTSNTSINSNNSISGCSLTATPFSSSSNNFGGLSTASVGNSIASSCSYSYSNSVISGREDCKTAFSTGVATSIKSSSSFGTSSASIHHGNSPGIISSGVYTSVSGVSGRDFTSTNSAGIYSGGNNNNSNNIIYSSSSSGNINNSSSSNTSICYSTSGLTSLANDSVFSGLNVSAGFGDNTTTSSYNNSSSNSSSNVNIKPDSGGSEFQLQQIKTETDFSDGCANNSATQQYKAVQQSQVSSSRPSFVPNDILAPFLLKVLKCFLFVVNSQGKIEFISENVTEFLKYNQEELLGKSIYNIIHHGDHQEFSKRFLPLSLTSGLAWPSQPQTSTDCTFHCRMLFKDPREEEQDVELKQTYVSKYETMQVTALPQPCLAQNLTDQQLHSQGESSPQERC
ncbi:hypothetical protein EGW08_015593, partial [Elysia chlorotica]